METNNPQDQQTQPHEHKSHTGIYILLVIAILVLLGILGLFLWNTVLLEESTNDLNDLVQEDDQAMDVEDEENMEEEEEIVLDTRYAEILVHSNGDNFYDYQGVAVLEGYYTTTEETTSLDGSGPTVTCSSFVVTDGPTEALGFVNDFYGGRIVLGAVDEDLTSTWWNTRDIRESTVKNSVTAAFSIGSRFEGEIVGCINPWVQFIGTTE